jgi:hypothetical protein
MTTKTITLKAGTAAHLVHLEAIGKKRSTIGTAKRTLELLVAQMGEDKEIGKILPVHVAAFFKSEAATMLKGKPRAEASVKQIRRIVRAALVWWHEQGYSEKLPLPASEKAIQEKHANAETRRAKKGAKKDASTEPATEPATETTDAGDAPADSAE